MPTKKEKKVQVHKKRVIRVLHIPILMYGGKGKKLKKRCIVKDIEHQREKRAKMTELQRMKEFDHLCLRIVRSKELRRNGGIDPMFLITL